MYIFVKYIHVAYNYVCAKVRLSSIKRFEFEPGQICINYLKLSSAVNEYTSDLVKRKKHVQLQIILNHLNAPLPSPVTTVVALNTLLGYILMSDWHISPHVYLVASIRVLEGLALGTSVMKNNLKDNLNFAPTDWSISFVSESSLSRFVMVKYCLNVFL